MFLAIDVRVLFIILTVFKCIYCANILAIFTVPSKSHSILGYELFKELVKSGHQVTVISPQGNELKDPPQNYTNIIVSGSINDEYDKRMTESFEMVETNPVEVFNIMINTTSYMTKYVIKYDKVQQLLKSDIKFDLVISELSMNEAVLGFSEHYKCPHIVLSTVGGTSWVDYLTSNPSPYSYIPHIFLDLTERMNFIQRLQNTAFNIIEGLMIRHMQYTEQKQIYETEFLNANEFRPFWDKMKHGVSLVFLNSHYTINYPRPFLPNLIEVCGMHIKRIINQLPPDIENFIDESESVIYFSLGGNLNPSVMDIQKQKAIISSLSKLKERIIWKWDDENILVDKNKFLVKKWFPQDDILAHPKVKLFITHGGLLSGSESVYYGKPLVVIPIFGDQKLNAARTVKDGIGVRVDYNNLTEESLTWAINEVMENQKYTTKVKELSVRFRDRPQHPVDLAKFYVEYVIRHQGATFMQSSATHLNFIEIHNIDVILTLSSIVILVLWIPLKLMRKLYMIFFGAEKEKERQKKKRQ